MAIKDRVGVAASKPQGPKMPQINIDFMKLWSSFTEHVPPILKDPVRLLSTLLKYTNYAIT